MPCFKGIAVSIHANGSPLPEHGMQKQSRVSRISTYIPVPRPQLHDNNPQTNPSKFAISITLLTPGMAIPYSTPKPTPSNPNPRPHYVGGLPPFTPADRQPGVVNPYVALTNSENETIAAYIYFDGRGKEEVATLLRPGEETWVNSRWVQVPMSEGGGLAEREFLFREVSLEKWLNGLDLKGHDAAEKLEKRLKKHERRRRRQATSRTAEPEIDAIANGSRDTLRYVADENSPVEAVFDANASDLDSSDDELPEAAGQIKVAMFRVIASGEIKKGEYSPQFDAHDDDDDDDDDDEESVNKNSGIDANVEHTTSFAQPKTLDPKTISTQTVTGIDGPDKPYAVFTFFYRGERKLNIDSKCSMLSAIAPSCLQHQTLTLTLQVNFERWVCSLHEMRPRQSVKLTSANLDSSISHTLGHSRLRERLGSLPSVIMTLTRRAGGSRETNLSVAATSWRIAMRTKMTTTWEVFRRFLTWRRI